ncbi:YjjG family noncanonical pyrimidine nucleotidase [uncultured Dokdonia sp.]|uniref:YjjG family noncanonical pyrimidine nucleotidase n=1 Tax=Dokdonia sp. Asnod2-E02 TaxID=3160574 RepID=UPI00261A6D30|nr:YjjG family noncanonical pyrimidine nucleotidase [uncultured Dokdonia sp.]
MSNITDVFFDLDHTLWDFDRNSGLAFIKIFEKNNLSVNYDEFLEVYSPINFKQWKWYREERITKAQLRYGRFKKTFDKMGISVTDDIIDKLSEDYIDCLPENNHLFEGTIELLDYLSPRYKMHIITNGFQEVQTTKMNKSGLAPYFETMTTSESVGVKKPNEKIFHFAMDKAGANPSQSIMIGDTYEADIVGALKVGMDAICFNYHKLVLPQEIKVVDDIKHLKSFL